MAATVSPGADPVAASPKTGQRGPLQPGQTFGTRYHIIRLLGTGGMGAVYQAWDSELNVAVAVKVIRPELARQQEVLYVNGSADEVLAELINLKH